MNINNKIINDYHIQTGANNKQYCPNPEHHDNNPGSFSWFLPKDSDMPVGYCFSCGYSITLDKYLAERDNLTPQETQEMMKNKTTFKRKTTKHYIKRSAKLNEPPVNKQSEGNPVSLSDIDRCYSIVLNFCRLSNKGRNYLKARGLSNQEIKLYGFVDTFNEKAFHNYMHEHHKNQKLLNKMTHVAGFYLDYNDQVKFNFPKDAIIIPITDTLTMEPETIFDGSVHDTVTLIKGLQYRNMADDADVRYKWVSSAYERAGTPATAYHGLMTKRSSDLFITEGFFKARFLADNTSADVAYVQGIRNTNTLLNWLKNRQSFTPEETVEHFVTDQVYIETQKAVNDGCIDSFKTILNNLNGRVAPEYKRVFVAYDIDVYDTPEKEQALWSLVEKLKELNLRVFIITWKKELGKGIDDVNDMTLVNIKEV